MNAKSVSVPEEEAASFDDASRAESASEVDFDLHGFVGIRCVDAKPRDVAAVARQLGPIKSSRLNREPDIVLRFVDQIQPSSPLRYLDLDDAAFTDDAFYMLRGKHKSLTKVQIPFDEIGGRCVITCEHGLAAVPELVAIINQTALTKGFLPMHAAAFTHEGMGVLVTGWSKGGKTETLLGAMDRGADYVGDEWVYLDQGGRRMFGIPEPIRVWQWHLDCLPRYRNQLGTLKRLQLRLLNGLVAGASWITGPAKGQSSAPKKLLIRLLPLLRKQLHVDWAPAEIFGDASLAMSGIPDRIVFVGTHESQEITVEPIDPAVVARRMLYSLKDERDDFMANYRKFRFAFPDRPNAGIDQADERMQELLLKALEGKQTYAVYHSYPVSIPQLFEAIRAAL